MKILKTALCVLAALVVALNIVMIVKQGGLDGTPPEITVASEVLEVSVHGEETEYLSGVTARDDRDGDLTDQVLVEHISLLTGPDTAKITYAVFDKAGNAATASRTVRFTDYAGPRFQLSEPLNYSIGETVRLMDRLTATDDLDGDITGRIRITSQSLSNDIAGIYYLGVQVTSSLGDTRLLELPVIIDNITDKTPSIVLSGYIAYVERDGAFDPESYLVEVEDPMGKGGLSRVEIQSGVDTAIPGTYEVAYSYEGEKDDTQVILTVIVTE